MLMMGLLEYLLNRKLQFMLLFVACGLLPYLAMWIHSMLANEETALPLYTSVLRFSREREEPIFKVDKVARRNGHSGLIFDLDVRGRFSSMEKETDQYDEDWDNQLSTTQGMKEARRQFRGRICSLHNDMLASRLIHQDEKTWTIINRSVSSADFGKMSDKERREFKEQLLKTVVFSVKVRTLNEPICRSGQGILCPNSSGDEFESNLTKPLPTKNGTQLIFKKRIHVTRNTQLMCTEKRQQSVVHQILRTTKLPDKSSSWFSWFSGPDLTMQPGNRCHMDNQIIQDSDYHAFPKTVLSTLFCF